MCLNFIFLEWSVPNFHILGRIYLFISNSRIYSGILRGFLGQKSIKREYSRKNFTRKKKNNGRRATVVSSHYIKFDFKFDLHFVFWFASLLIRNTFDSHHYWFAYCFWFASILIRITIDSHHYWFALFWNRTTIDSHHF